ncbi:MAG: glycosyl transferase family protein [Octadecabacter sp.]
MTLAPYVRIVAQGKGRARSLTLDEADTAMSAILSGDAAPEAIGALLMVLRLRGETDEEIAGFTRALRRSVSDVVPSADLDWPCYAAGRTRGAPLFLLAARLVADAGYTVSMHGWNSHQSTAADLREAIDDLNIAGAGLTYAPLESLSQRAFDLLALRDTFGLRSCINTVLRMWNPSAASASVQGVFHPSYRGLQSRAAALLGDRNLTVIKGGGGEFERNPAKDAALFGLCDGDDIDASAPALFDATRRLHEPDSAVDLADLWFGRDTSPFGEATVIGTAAIALWTLKDAPTIAECEAKARALWSNRLGLERKTA